MTSPVEIKPEGLYYAINLDVQCSVADNFKQDNPETEYNYGGIIYQTGHTHIEDDFSCLDAETLNLKIEKDVAMPLEIIPENWYEDMKWDFERKRDDKQEVVLETAMAVASKTASKTASMDLQADLNEHDNGGNSPWKGSGSFNVISSGDTSKDRLHSESLRELGHPADGLSPESPETYYHQDHHIFPPVEIIPQVDADVTSYPPEPVPVKLFPHVRIDNITSELYSSGKDNINCEGIQLRKYTSRHNVDLAQTNQSLLYELLKSDACHITTCQNKKNTVTGNHEPTETSLNSNQSRDSARRDGGRRSLIAKYGEKTFTGERDLDEQININNELKRRLPARYSKKTCTNCGKQLKQGQYLTVYIGEETVEKNLLCNLCEKRFSLEKILERTHKAMKFRSCNIFKKQTSQLNDSQVHMVKLPSNKHLLCSLCNRGFYKEGELKRHQNAHTRNIQFYCRRCNRQFTKISSLTEHIRIHGGDMPFSCNHCGKLFRLQGDLRKHKLRKHIE